MHLLKFTFLTNYNSGQRDKVLFVNGWHVAPLSHETVLFMDIRFDLGSTFHSEIIFSSVFTFNFAKMLEKLEITHACKQHVCAYCINVSTAHNQNVTIKYFKKWINLNMFSLRNLCLFKYNCLIIILLHSWGITGVQNNIDHSGIHINPISTILHFPLYEWNLFLPINQEYVFLKKTHTFFSLF